MGGRYMDQTACSVPSLTDQNIMTTSLLLLPPGMTPNDKFLAEVKARFTNPADDKIVVVSLPLRSILAGGSPQHSD